MSGSIERRVRRLERASTDALPNHLPFDQWSNAQLDAGLRQLLPEWGRTLGDADLPRLIAEEKARIGIGDQA